MTRDKIRKGGRASGKGLKIKYVSHAGTDWEREHNPVTPPSGYIVPTADSSYNKEAGLWMPLQNGTGIPYATIESRRRAIELIADYFTQKSGIDERSAKRLARKWVSYFLRPDRYNSEILVGRDFDPDFDDDGRFYVSAGGLPSGSGYDVVASRPIYTDPETTVEIIG